MPNLLEEKSPLSRFALFTISLALVASLVAGAWVYAIELPAQTPGQPPSNSHNGEWDFGEDSPGGGNSQTCGGHYDNKGNLIGYTCCTSEGIPVSCTYYFDLIKSDL